ncbi:transcriptional regulator, partial [Campylobacter jejuni]
NDELLKLHLDLFENIKNLELKNAIKKNENIITQICP